MAGKRIRWQMEEAHRGVGGPSGLLLRSSGLHVMDPVSRSFVAVPEPFSTEDPAPACRVDIGLLGYDVNALPRLAAGGRALSSSITHCNSGDRVHFLHQEVAVDPGSWGGARVAVVLPASALSSGGRVARAGWSCGLGAAGDHW